METSKHLFPYIPFNEYETLFTRIKLSRDDDGVLTVQLHKDGGEFFWNFAAHREVAMLWNYIGMDPENKIIILTGTGENFLKQSDFEASRGAVDPFDWFLIHQDGKKILMDLLEIEQPIIVALNGPVHIHSQIPLLGDILLCTPDTVISDNHVPRVLPGDGHHLIWPLLMGLNRAKYLLLLQKGLSAQEAKDIGVINEIVPRDQLMDRARELARELLQMNPLVLRQFRPVVMQPIKQAVLNGISMGMLAEGWSVVSKL